MTTEQNARLDELCARIQEFIAPYAGRVEYGNLRFKITRWDEGGEPTTNIALVYETPGGSTDQINISFAHQSERFALIDAQEGEIATHDPGAVMESIHARVHSIPEKRREHLYAEIRRQVDGGTNTAGLVGHLNRMMQSGFKGGAMTHIEMRDAMAYAVKYMKERNFPGANAPS